MTLMCLNTLHSNTGRPNELNFPKVINNVFRFWLDQRHRAIFQRKQKKKKITFSTSFTMQITQSTLIDQLVGNVPKLLVQLLWSSVSVAGEKGDCWSFRALMVGIFSTPWKPLPVSHILTVMSSLVAQPCFSVRLCDSVCVCVFYNWLRLLHNPVDTGSPFTPPPSSRYGKIVSTKAILDKTTNKCKGAQGCFSSTVSFLTQRHSRKESRPQSTRNKKKNVWVGRQACSHAAAMQLSSGDPGRSGNRQSGCLTLPPSPVLF